MKENPLKTNEILKFIQLEEELYQLENQQNVKKKQGGFGSYIDKLLEIKEKEHSVIRKKYILLASLFGWVGLHRFYAKQYVTAWLSVLFCWTGIPAGMAMVDIMVALPKTEDEYGKVKI